MGTYLPAAMVGLSAFQTYQKDKFIQAQGKQAQTQYEQQKQQAALALKEKQKARKNLLKQQLARQKAAMAASGISSGTGSGLAVSEGLKKQANEDLAANRSFYDMDMNALSTSLAAQRRKNLFDLTNNRINALSGSL